MGDQDGKKPTPPSRKGKGPTPSSWRPGQSGNPRGRPRAGLAFAERVRERIDPDLVIDLALEVAEDKTLPAVQRLRELLPLVHAGYLKPPSDARLEVTQGPAQSLSVALAGRLSVETLREIEQAHTAQLEAGEPPTADVCTATPEPTTG